MNIGAQFHTKEGNVYVADVVNKRIMKIGQDGKKSAWTDYLELNAGSVGESLIIHWPKSDKSERKPVKTSEIVKLEFPKIGD